MTEEHLWPEWMHAYLPQIPGTKTQAGRSRMRLGQLVTQQKLREGHVFTKRFRLVCRRCNTGWMSGIEDEVKPTLTPMLQGQGITLLKNHRIRLAHWIALKVMVMESIDLSDCVITEFEREDYRATGTMPRLMRIFVGTHDLDEWYTGFWHQTLRAHLGPTPPAQTNNLGGFKNIPTTAFGIGRIFSLTFVTTIQDLGFNPIFGNRKVRRLWPLRDQVIAWPLKDLSLSEANQLAQSVAELRDAPIARWLPYPPCNGRAIRETNKLRLKTHASEQLDPPMTSPVLPTIT
jgi:hypothetical protein